MDIPDVLRDSYAMDFLAMLENAPLMEIAFRGVRNNYYKNRETLETMVDAGLIKIIDEDRKRGKTYAITEKGRKVHESFGLVCDQVRL